MAELDAITAALQQQRKDLDEQLDRTASRREEAAGLLEKIADLRARAERTQRIPAQPRHTPRFRKK